MRRLPFMLLSIVALLMTACPQEPRDRPDVACADVCKKRIVGCSVHECERGCAFVMDRLVEHQQDTILHCVEMSGHGCEDKVWAECAVRVGVHEDGGPDVPPPPSTEF